MKIFAPTHPLVLNGTYDEEGYTPKERARERRHRQALHERTAMRLFDEDGVGCYLDAIGHRVVKATNGIAEHKVVDLTLRVQPFTPELAVALDPDVRALLFSMTDATPKPKIRKLDFALTVPRQQLAIAAMPDLPERILFADCAVGRVRARTDKAADGFALVFTVSYGPASSRDLEYVTDWLMQQRFVTFQPQQPALDFAAAPDASVTIHGSGAFVATRASDGTPRVRATRSNGARGHRD